MKIKHLIIPIALILTACSGRSVKIDRVDRALAVYGTADAELREEILDSMNYEIQAFFDVLGQPELSQQLLEHWSYSDVVTAFQPAVDSVFPNLDAQQRVLGTVVKRAAKDSLDFSDLRFAAVVWGKPQPVVRIDNVVLIALNHFLGADHEAYSHWPEYRRQQKNPDNLIYTTTAALVATARPIDPAGASLLDWMLYEGRLVDAQMRYIPDAKLEIALGCTADELKWLEKNYKQIRQAVVGSDILHTTDPSEIDRALAGSLPVADAPRCTLRYLGYRQLD